MIMVVLLKLVCGVVLCLEWLNFLMCGVLVDCLVVVVVGEDDWVMIGLMLLLVMCV